MADPRKMSTSSKSSVRSLRSVSDYGTIAQYDTDSDKSSDISPHGNDYDGGSGSEVPYDRARRRSFIEEDEDPLQIELPVKKPKPVTWSSLPHKGQLAILTAARLAEPLVQTSLRVSTCRNRLHDLILTRDSHICSTNSSLLTRVFRTL